MVMKYNAVKESGPFKLATVDFKHGKGTTQVHAVAQEGDNGTSTVRFYTRPLIANVAYDELTKHNASIETLSSSFKGRDATEMYAFLDKNYVEPK